MKRHYCASDVDSLKVYKPEIHAEVQDKLISSSSMLMGLINTTTCLQGENSVMVKFWSYLPALGAAQTSTLGQAHAPEHPLQKTIQQARGWMCPMQAGAAPGASRHLDEV